MKQKKLLTRGEPKAVTTLNARGKGRGLILCDHSSKRVPKSLKGLGISKKELSRHIGWDIGTEDIGVHMCKTLDMPGVFSGYSRLVIDLNRHPDSHECIIEKSDHTPIPANIGITPAARRMRMREVYEPYQKEVGRQIDRLVKKHKTPLIIAIHSYTPKMDGKKRPWHIAILWNGQKKIATKVLRELRQQNPKLIVGDNEPYTMQDGRYWGLTVYRHAQLRGIPYIFVEFRQDLVDTKAKARKWADLFMQAIADVVAKPEAWLEPAAKTVRVKKQTRRATKQTRAA